MADLRSWKIAGLAAFVAACSAPPSERIANAELGALAPLKQHYSDLIAGLDIRPGTTLIVSVDLQNYIEADDARTAAMRRDALARWRETWLAQHPREHAALRVRFIDFIGRKVAQQTTNV